MLAIARALLTNPTLMVMDEPSEGLAPTIIENLIETFETLVQEGVGILLIEQNLGVATAVADRQLVMVAGSIHAETTAAALSQTPSRSGVTSASSRSPEHERAMATVVLRRHSRHEGRGVRVPRDRLREQGVDVLLVDAGVFEPSRSSPTSRATRSPRAAGADVAELAAAGDRGAAVEAMARGAAADRQAAARRGRLDGMLALGGSGGSSIADPCDARAPGRRAEADGLDARLGRHTAVRRSGRRDDDVLGRRHRRTEPRLGADHRERCRRDRRHGAGRRRRSSTDKPLVGATMFGVTTRA